MNNRLLLSALLIALGAVSFFYMTKKNTRSGNKTEDTTLVVGTNAAYAPFEFIDNNEVVGYDIDVIKEVGKRLGKTIEIKDMSFDALIPEIQLGSVHVIAAALTPTPERAQRVLFATPHIDNDPFVIISLASNPINSVDELSGKEVIVNQGFSADLYVSKLPDVAVNRLETVGDAMLALKSGRGDAFVTSEKSSRGFFEKQGKKGFHIVGIPDTAETGALAISKQHPALLDAINGVLAQMETDGTLTTLKKKWNLL